MFLKKLAKGLMMGVCVSMLSTGVAYAAETNDVSTSKANEISVTTNAVSMTEAKEATAVQTKEISVEDTKELSTPETSEMVELKGEGQSGSYAGDDALTYVVDEKILQKQQEIDRYVYETNISELKEMGFEVTYTSPMEGYVEIGILPYEESYADYLFEVFGKETIQVVEGEKVIMYTTAASGSPDTSIASDGETYVGEGVVLEEGEVGITSMGAETEVVDPEAQDKMADSGMVETTETVAYDDRIVQTTSVEEDTNIAEEKDNTSMLVTISIIGGAVVVSGIVILGSKKKIIKRM